MSGAYLVLSKAAPALYDSAGYREIPAYNDNQYAEHWFDKPVR